MAQTRRAKDADAAYQERIRHLLACVTSDGVFVSSAVHASPGRPRVLSFLTDLARLALPGGDRLFLSVEHEYTVTEDAAGEWEARGGPYSYTLYDAAQHRLLGYHFHPSGRGTANVTIPHLHVFAPIVIAGQHLGKLHMPTGMVRVADLVEFLIAGLKVQPPARQRSVWRTLVARERLESR